VRKIASLFRKVSLPHLKTLDIPYTAGGKKAIFPI